MTFRWIHLVFFIIVSLEKHKAYEDFDHLPKNPVDYRHFAVQSGQGYKIVGSCSQLKLTEPMSRCILTINHKYIVKYISMNYVSEIIGSGIIIKKLIEPDTNTIFILTAFHIAVPNMDLNFWTFAGISFMTSIILLMGSLIQYSAIILPRLFKVLCCLTLYMVITTSMMYYILWFLYPTIFESLFKFGLVPKGQDEFISGSDFVTCQLVSSRFILSKEWFDDIAIIKCSNVETNILNYVEACVPTLNSTQSVLSGSTMSTIGFVGRAPESFDLLINPFFSSSSPLVSIPSVNGKKPGHFLLNNKFMNCTGKLRVINYNKLFIDTPATYGFSGGPCIITATNNPWQFIGILTGASRLWNTCISLRHSTIFQYYYENLILNDNNNNLKKNDL